jgi:hypothetical protein
VPAPVTVIQLPLLDDVQAHVERVPTEIVPLLAVESAVMLVGVSETLHGAGCVTVKLFPATVTTAER